MSIDLIILVIILSVLLLVIAIFFYLEFSFKCRLRIKEVVNGRKIIHQYKAKEYTDKDGITWWRVKGGKNQLKKVSCPPEVSIELDYKGKKCAEAYKTETGEIIWIRDSWQIDKIPEEVYENIPKEILDIKDDIKREQAIDDYVTKQKKDYMRKNKVVEPHQPLTTNQRVLYIDQMRKAQERKGLDWKAQLVPIVSLGILGLVIIAGMVFASDIAAPFLEEKQLEVAYKQAEAQQTQALADIALGIQRIEDKIGLEQDPTIPN